jgi:hypothetical protein
VLLALLALAMLSAFGRPVAAQLMVPEIPAADTGGVGFQAIGLMTQARPGVAGEHIREFYVTQPIIVLHDPGPHVSGHMMLNFEAWSLKDGELNAGTWGEGFVDRRHPHTFLHEVMFSAQAQGGIFGGSVAAGRGVVPFGSDDPMTRPFVKYPFNHHLAQVLERWMGVGAVRVGRFAVEAATFNGDEPDGPRSTGDKSRIGDSFAGRATVWPLDALELQLSRAWVESPEHVGGGSLDHEKWHASARWDAALGGLPLYALYEWGRTDEFDDETKAYSFETTLLEGAVDVETTRVALRWERTTRPEEERLEDPFRTARPHEDATLIGVTRWSGLTLHLENAGGSGSLRLAPFFEVSRLHVEEVTGALFDPLAFYGKDVQWSLSAGVRVSTGIRPVRMGRYGVALRSGSHTMDHE